MEPGGLHPAPLYRQRLSTEIGLRHDKNEQYGSENTWNAALTVPLDTRNDVIVSYSEGFRAPTFNELYDSWFGNPDLTPEKSKSYEVQWRNRYSDSGSLELSLYRTDIEDAIVSTPSGFLRMSRLHGSTASRPPSGRTCSVGRLASRPV